MKPFRERNGNVLERDPARWQQAVLVLILVSTYLNLPVYLFKLENGLLPKYFYFGFVLLMAPMLLLRLKNIGAYITSPFVLWALALLALNLVHLLTSQNPIEHRINQLILTRVQTLVMIIILVYGFLTVRIDVYRWTFALLAVLAPCIVVFDFLFPGTLYPQDLIGAIVGRAGGTFINPNDAASSMLVIFVLACSLVSKKYRLPLFLLCCIGVAVTFSRAAIIACAMLWLLLLARRRIPTVGAVVIMIAMLAPFAMGSIESYLNTRSELAGGIENIQQRLSFFSSKRVDDESSQARLEVLELGWKAFVHNPVTGIGAASTSVGVTELWPYSVNTHNQLMSLAAEYGVGGVVIWIWLAFLLLRGRYLQDRTMQAAGAMVFFLMTFFTHNMFDFPFWLITFAMLSQRARQFARPRHDAPYSSAHPVPA
jgi:hypothetical protein